MTSTPSNRFDSAKQEGRVAIGTICTLDGYATTQLIAATGADFVLLDKQHAAYDWSELETLCWRTRGAGAAVFIRTASIDPAELNLVLDLPVDGIMLPNIASVEQAKAAFRTTRFPPRGDRSIGNIRTTSLLGRDMWDPHAPLVGMLVEHIDVVKAIDKVLALGPDFVMIGPHDLAASMGLDARTEPHRPKELEDAIAVVRKAANKAGVGWWQWLPAIEGAAAAAQPGTEALLWSVDALLVADTFRSGFAGIKRAVAGANGKAKKGKPGR